MRKLFLTCALTITIIALVAGCQQGASLIATPTEEAIVLPTPTHEPDFRSVNWGMSREQVIEIEGEYDYDNRDRIYYNDVSVNGCRADLMYTFDNNKLYKGSYVIKGSLATYNNYIDFIEKLTEKYGKPVVDEINWAKGVDPTKVPVTKYDLAIQRDLLYCYSEWRYNRTTIEMSILYSDGATIIIIYNNRFYTPSTDGL